MEKRTTILINSVEMSSGDSQRYLGRNQRIGKIDVLMQQTGAELEKYYLKLLS